MALERDIHQLLYTHDCVIVPGFGGFLTHYRPARLDEQRQLVHPPAKDVSFNRHLTRTDGLLTDHVARRIGSDFARAGQEVDAEVDGWKKKLQDEGRLELGRIGTFFRDAERNLQFEPDKRVNFLKEAYGLRAVAAVPVETAKPARPAAGPVPIARVVPIPVATTGGEEVPAKRGAPTFLAAAAVAALLFTAATWWVVASDMPVGAQWSGFDVFGSAEPRRYTAGLPLQPGPDRANDTLPWSAPADLSGVHQLAIAGGEGPLVAVDLGGEHATQVPAVKAVPESTAVATRTVHARYHIIGGCFEQKENADKFVAELQAKGFAAILLDRKGGLYRVAYGSYPERAMALDALNAVRKEEAPQAWLLVK
ncbi:MAG: SPOR domain-containing protein [Bacteroidetes bacterium]|nr:SPOR domain-containing protein [Bacteroidota bacterium]